MNVKVTIDGAGRVVIPKEVRDALRLSPGDALDLQTDGEQLTLRPKRPSARMRKKQDVWVFHSGVEISVAQTNEVLAAIREGRDKR